jgi:tetratricopeptide (TPR) repeat protein
LPAAAPAWQALAVPNEPALLRLSGRLRRALAAVVAATALSATAAEPQLPATTPAATATPAAAASATDAYGGFRREFDAARYEAAIPYAQRVLELAQQAAPSPTDETVLVALMNLGMTQNLADDFVAAESTFLRVIDLVQRSGRPQHARLARAYAGLATAYHEGNRHDLAVKSFDQAIALTRRHEGVLTEQQVPLLEQYIDSLTELGRYEDAVNVQRYLLRIATRKYGADSLGIVPRLEQIGRWYASVGAYDASRRTLKYAIDIVESTAGRNAPELVGPLLALAVCNRRQMLDPTQQAAGPDGDTNSVFNNPDSENPQSGLSPRMMASEGERALLRAVEITEGMPEPSPELIATVRVQTGDWYQLRGQPERALPHYVLGVQAAGMISEKTDGKSWVDALFGAPVMLHIVRAEGWNRYAQRPATEVEVLNFVVEAEVNARGQVVAAKVIDDAGDAKRAEKAAASLGSARYRPRFELGQPVATTGVRFTQPWFTLLPPPEKPEAAPPPVASQPTATPEAASPGAEARR